MTLMALSHLLQHTWHDSSEHHVFFFYHLSYVMTLLPISGIRNRNGLFLGHGNHGRLPHARYSEELIPIQE